MTRMTRATQVLSLLLVALTMGLEFAHTLELGPKLNYPPELYLRLNTSLYAWFGIAPPVGGAIWLGAMVSTGMLLLLLRQRPVRLFTGASLVLQLAAFANYFARVEPVNVRFRALTPGQVPPDFAALRTQWEYGHAVGFALFTVAFLLLLIALVTVVNSTAPTFPRGRMSVRSSSRRRPHDGMRATVEFGVLAALLVSFVTIPLPVPHVVTAIAWTTLTAIHVVRRRRIYAGLLRSAQSSAPPAHGWRRRVVATTALIGCAVTVTLSGFAQWAGLAAATPWHAGSSMLLIGLAAMHATSRLWRTHRRRPVGSRSALVAHRRPATRATR